MMTFGISSRFQLLSQSPGQVSHVLRTRSPLSLPEQAPWTSFDLHVLSVPPAFILSQDQTLQQKRVPIISSPKRLKISNDMSASATTRRKKSVMLQRPAGFGHPSSTPAKPTHQTNSHCIHVAADRDVDSRIDKTASRDNPTK
jgi:hypothetical protein